MTALDEARTFAIDLRSARSPWTEHNRIYEARHQAARIIDGLVAMVEAQEGQKVDSGQLVQRVLRVMDHDLSGLTHAKLAEQIVAGIRDLLAHQVGHPKRLADARRAGAEEMRGRAAEVPQATFAQMHSHAPSESYEAGFADACRECELSIRALPVQE